MTAKNESNQKMKLTKKEFEFAKTTTHQTITHSQSFQIELAHKQSEL